MADYRQLLIKAIDALAENNGAQRREVYEKARKALVAQLRSITPPLPAREITQHRLELEDCIRQVEQEATENILGGLKKLDEEPMPAPAQPPAPAPAPPPAQPAPEKPAAPVEPVAEAPVPAPAPAPAPTPAPAPEEPAEAASPAPAPPPADPPAPAQPETEPDVDRDSVAELTAALEGEASPAAPETVDTSEPIAAPAEEADEPEDDVSSIDAIIARAEAARAQNPLADSPPAKPAGQPKPSAPSNEVTDPPAPAPSAAPVPAPAPPPVPQPAPAQVPAAEPVPAAATASAPAPNQSTSVSDRAIGAAMSRVREVEVDFDAPEVARADEQDDSQLAIDRAIEMLDREARGELSEQDNEEEDPVEQIAAASTNNDAMLAGENRMVSSGDDEKGGNALTIFLVLAVVLLLGAGGAGYWAWREGYVDLDALFAQATVTPPTSEQVETPIATEDGPGNTATDPSTPAPTETLPTNDTPANDERLPAATTNDVPGAESADDPDKVEDRLTSEAPSATEAPIDSADPNAAVTTGNGAQSLLLEASADGTTGAVPFSGTVSWARETDELGQPTLVGTASIPARNLDVRVLIRRNADPTLPASHLVEIQFDTSETFVGGTIASFGGILLKNEELVPGRPLVGAPARVFENMFLFALSAAEPDVRTNLPLLENNKWMDLAIIYGTGRQAIITLEKDDAAQAMFEDVLASWAEQDQAAASE